MKTVRSAAASVALLVGAAWTASAGAQTAPGDEASPKRITPWPASGASAPAPWRTAGLPDQKKPYTAFSVATVDGRRALRIEADRSYGNLLHPLRVEPGAVKALAWRWRIEQLNEQADLRQRSGDDTTVKVCALFDLPFDKVPFIDRQVLGVARSMTSEMIPTASICYVWDARLAVGTELPNAFSSRLRYVVLESGTARVGEWVGERRDVMADFRRLFGGESGGQAVPLIGVAVGADADNTRQRSVAYVADVMLEP